MFADAPAENKGVGSSEDREVRTDRFADPVTKHIDRQTSMNIAATLGGLQFAHVARDS